MYIRATLLCLLVLSAFHINCSMPPKKNLKKAAAKLRYQDQGSSSTTGCFISRAVENVPQEEDEEEGWIQVGEDIDPDDEGEDPDYNYKIQYFSTLHCNAFSSLLVLTVLCNAFKFIKKKKKGQKGQSGSQKYSVQSFQEPV
jgi:hypothetical protein